MADPHDVNATHPHGDGAHTHDVASAPSTDVAGKHPYDDHDHGDATHGDAGHGHAEHAHDTSGAPRSNLDNPDTDKRSAAGDRRRHPHNHGDHGHEHGRLAVGDPGVLRAVVISSFVLGLVAAVELATAALSSSAAVLADGLHNLGDVSTTVALAAAFLLSRRAPTQKFPYGYHRGEDLAGLLVLLLVIGSAVASGITSIEHLIHRQPLTHPGIALGAALFGALGNEGVARYKTSVGRRIGSMALTADGQHSRIDGLASLAAAVGVGGSMLGVPLLDPLTGIGITVVIAVVAWDTAKNVTGRLLDEADASLIATLTEVATSVEGVVTVTAARARWTGRRVYAELTLEMAPTKTLDAAHAVGEEVRHRLYHRVESLADVIVHLDPAGMLEAHGGTAHHRAGG